MGRKYGNLIIFVLTLFLLGTMNALAGNNPEVSQLENRSLKTKPEFCWEDFMSGDYFRAFEEYFADNFIFREQFVLLSRTIMELSGIPGQEKAVLVTHQGANVFQSEGEEAKKVQNSRIQIIGDRGMELHKFNEEASRLYAEVLNAFAAKVAGEARVYSMIVPTQIEFIPQERFRRLSSPQQETIDFISALYSPAVKTVMVGQAIKDHSSEYVYFRTDHHWTARGAYWAYAEFMKNRGEEPEPLESYQTARIDSFLGSLYSTTLNDKLKANPDELIYYQPFTDHQYEVIFHTEPVPLNLLEPPPPEQKNKYGIFLGGDMPLGKITTDVKNQKRILVIKDSYGNAFVPFLLPHYEEIYVIDPRLYNKDVYDLITENKIGEVLFLNYVLCMDNPGFAQLLAKMLDF